MSVEHFALLMRFRNGEPMNRAEIDRLCQLEGDNWPRVLYLEELQMKQDFNGIRELVGIAA
jgi:hypothetical protein